MGYEETLILLHSHFDFRFIVKQPIKRLSKCILKAKEKENDRKAWELWLAKYPHMTKDNFQSFHDFKEQIKKPYRRVEHANESVQDRFTRFKRHLKNERKGGRIVESH
ncbi:hypothetical protein [Evansella halocellulosilytica]|uniref:hypothetical protein n=1 Tax=Evansella halocellulosilytica TaxID=2011013 RepID=UPI000BB724F3|nr:hypothetical protein [Evansella halocellulosilytica]